MQHQGQKNKNLSLTFMFSFSYPLCVIVIKLGRGQPSITKITKKGLKQYGYTARNNHTRRRSKNIRRQLDPSRTLQTYGKDTPYKTCSQMRQILQKRLRKTFRSLHNRNKGQQLKRKPAYRYFYKQAKGFYKLSL